METATATKPRPPRKSAPPRMPAPRTSLAAAAGGCGLADAITVAGDHSWERLQVGQEVAVYQPMKIHQILPHELVLMGPSGTRRVRRNEIVRHVEVTK